MHTRPYRRARRFATALTAGLAAAVLLAGCTPSSGSANSASTSGADSGTLTVWHYYSLDNQVAMLDDYATTFEKAHPDVKVDNVYIPQDQINAKLVAAVGTQTGPDIIVFDGYSATTLISGGALAPLTDDWSSFSDASQIAKGAVTTVDGNVYSVQGYVNLLALYYNKDILDKLGLTPPTSMADLETQLAAAVGSGYQGITLAGQPDVQGAFQAYPWLTDAGFDYANPTQDSLVAAFTRIRSWVTNGYLSPEVSTWDQNVPFSKFMTGTTAFAENGSWQLASLAKDATFKYGVIPIPVGATGKSYLGGEAEGIGAFSKNPALAWKYLQETFLSKSGQLVALDKVGSIPTRADAAGDPKIAADPYLSEFSKAIAAQGAPFPDTAIPPKNDEAVILANGQAWSAALGGQTSPADAASSFLKTLTPLLQK